MSAQNQSQGSENLDSHTSDFTDNSVLSDRAVYAIQSKKLLKAYNEQGHYAVVQSFAKLFGCQMSSSAQHCLVVMFYLVSLILSTACFFVFFYWLQHEP